MRGTPALLQSPEGAEHRLSLTGAPEHGTLHPHAVWVHAVGRAHAIRATGHLGWMTAGGTKWASVFCGLPMQQFSLRPETHVRTARHDI